MPRAITTPPGAPRRAAGLWLVNRLWGQRTRWAWFSLLAGWLAALAMAASLWWPAVLPRSGQPGASNGAGPFSLLPLWAGLAWLGLCVLAAWGVVALLRTRDSQRWHAALSLHEGHLRAMLDAAPNGMLAIDERGTIVMVNAEMERLFGWPRKEMVGQSIEMLLPERYRGKHVALRTAYQASPQPRAMGVGRDLFGLRKNGVEFPVEIGLNPAGVQTATGMQVVASVVDITERKQAEAELRAGRDQIKNIFNAAPNGMLTIDRNGIIVMVNTQMERLFGWTQAEMLGQPVEMLLPERYRGKHLMLRHAYLQAPQPRAMGVGRDLFGLRKDGQEFPVEIGLNPTGGDAAQAMQVVASVVDITERKQAEALLGEANTLLEKRITERTQQLEMANRAKSDFLANMSHELRTPLNAIIGFSEMFKDGALGPLDERQRDFSADIYEAGKHLLSLINDILDLSKVEAGMLQLQLGPVDLPALFQTSTLMVREKALVSGIELETRVDPRLGTCLSDERKLKQIIYNLLSNGIKFTAQGGRVTLRFERCPRERVGLGDAMPGRMLPLPAGEDREFLAISVEDSGIGIAQDNLPKLFEPFVQVDSSAARLQSGTGLGLSLVRRLAELFGGTVGVSSQLGSGSRFHVWLPYREPPTSGEAKEAREVSEAGAPADAAASAEPSTADGALLTPSMPRGHLPLALVIEDDERMAELIASQLRADNFEVECALTAEEGLVRAVRHPPDLITLDIFLPMMDGFDFMSRIRKTPGGRHTPIVLITAFKDLDHGLALGARRVLQKPFTREQLRAALSGLVPVTPGRPQPCTVLVVDDNPKLIELASAYLEAEGYAVLQAQSGSEAIAAVQAQVPDLMVLDLVMPGISGFEVAAAMRRSERTADMPILVLTAMDLSEEDRRRLLPSVNAIMEKAGMSDAGLLAEVRRALPRCPPPPETAHGQDPGRR